MNDKHLKRELKGDRNQCPSCSEFFNSVVAFEKHRKPSKWFTGIKPTLARTLGYPHRCLTPTEMKSGGMEKNNFDYWVSSSYDKYKDKDK